MHEVKVLENTINILCSTHHMCNVPPSCLLNSSSQISKLIQFFVIQTYKLQQLWNIIKRLKRSILFIDVFKNIKF